MKTFRFSNRVLFFISLFLCVLFALSFIPGFSTASRKKNTGKAFTTALLNPDKAASVSTLELHQGGKSIALKKNTAGIWTGCESNEERTENDEKSFFCDEDEIKNIIGKLKNIIKLYKISDKIQNEQLYGLNENQRLWVKYSILDDETSFFIGNLDSSGGNYYISTADNIWKTKALLSELKKMNASVYVSPYLFPKFQNKELQLVSWKKIKNMSGASSTNSAYSGNPGASDYSEGRMIPSSSEDFTKLLSLRHGPLLSDYDASPENSTEESAPECIIKLEYSDFYFVNLSFFRIDEKSLYIKIQNEDVNYAVSVSDWTYKNLCNLLGLNI